MKTVVMSLLLIAGLHLAGQTGPSVHKSNYVALEIDPAPCVLGGYSFSLKYSHENLQHLTFMGSIYSSPLPDRLMGNSNYKNGFRELKIETSYAAFIDYFFNADRTGVHFGPSLFIYNKSVGTTENNSRYNFQSLYPNIRVGYVYKPFKSFGFYLNPWFNMGKEIVVSKVPTTSGVNYATPKLSYVLALHVGYCHTF